MDAMQAAIQLGLIVLAAVTVFFGIVIGWPVWLSHRRRVMELTSAQGRENKKLLERLEALEKRCEKLEEQVVETHIQLSDERRELDKKLSAILPDVPVPMSESETPPERVPARKRIQE